MRMTKHQNHQMHFAKWLHFCTSTARVPNIPLFAVPWPGPWFAFILLGTALDFTSRTLAWVLNGALTKGIVPKNCQGSPKQVCISCEQIRYLTFTSRGALSLAKKKNICHTTGHKWYTFCICDLLRFVPPDFCMGSHHILGIVPDIAPEIENKFVCS